MAVSYNFFDFVFQYSTCFWKVYEFLLLGELVTTRTQEPQRRAVVEGDQVVELVQMISN